VELDTAARFIQRAEADPAAIALRFGTRTMTFGELDAASSQLAHRLRECGVAAEVVVGVSMARGFHTPIALLAVAKAGGVYLPVDASLPAIRLKHVVDTAKPRLLLTESPMADDLPDLGVPLLRYDHEHDRIAVLPAECPERTVAPENLAYVVFTSGSTGVPKGIELTGRTLNHLVDWSIAANPDTRACAQLAPLGFDVSVQEMVVSLLAGRTLVLFAADLRREPEKLLHTLARDGVDTMHVPPAVLVGLAQAWEQDRVELPLRAVYTAGETLRVTPEVRRFIAAAGNVLLQNEWGMSEAQVVTTWPLTGKPDGWPAQPPIGRTVPGAELYLVDARLRPVPPGDVGELYVGGAAIARGYRARPDLTAERFVANPFGEPGSRMYRTGDLGRVRDDGVFEFVGRADRQVSLRGHRVEPGEIDAVLERHATVARALTVMRDGPGGGRLVSYVQAAPDVAEPAGLRAHAAEHLPEHMVPAAVVVLDEFPLNTNGKVDYAALPEPAVAGLGRGPRSPSEEILCALFAEVLGLPRVGIDDNFRELGGHSLLGAKLVARIRGALGVDLSIRILFDAPTVARLSALLPRTVEGPPPIRPPSEPPAVLPVSFAQRRFLYVEQLDGSRAAYTVRIALTLTGALDQDALRNALRDVIARHEPLRTVFPESAWDPCQSVLPAPEAAAVLSIRDIAEAELEAAVDAAAAHRFDLRTDRPIRATLFRVDPQRHVLLIVVHHIAVDGWSVPILMGDLSRAYGARLAGRSTDWARLPLRYADFAIWQRDLFHDGRSPWNQRDRQEAYWKSTLDGLPEAIALPLDRPRPAVRSGVLGSVPVEIDADTHRRVVELARRTDTTTFMVVQLAVVTLLSRLGGGADIPLGVPVAGRPDETLADLIGCFVNTVVLRTDLAGKSTALELLATLRETDLAAYAHQDLPFERVVDLVNPARRANRHPLYQAMLAFNNNVDIEPQFSGLHVDTEVRSGNPQADLAFDLRETREGIRGVLEFAVDVVEPASAATIAARFTLLVRQIVDAPDQPLSAADLLLPGERDRLARDTTGVSVPLPNVSLPELFRDQVARTPERPAVIFKGVKLTYAELDERIERGARALRAAGVVPGSVVAVSMPRSAELVVALHAVHRSGAAYLPIDPGQPPERTDFMLDAVRPSLVLTEGVLADLLANPLGEDPGPLPPPDAERPAYVMFTSGSTGRPKGVVVSHRAVANNLRWALAKGWLSAEDRLLHKASVAFDMSVPEVFGPLIAGAAVVVVPDGGHRDPGYLAELVARERITAVHMVPALLQAFLAEPAVAACTSLRTVFCGGERLPPAVRDQFHRMLRADLVNTYGPTETAVYVTECLVPAGSEQTVPIGRPLWNSRVHVLDSALRSTPPGVAGEIYLAGAQLADGYANRPDLTAERFVADPYGGPGERLYRTGDLGRWRPDGLLEFLDRNDRQVKIRGMRVELGEIEALLAGQDGIAQAVVEIRSDSPGGAGLVGYVVPEKDVTVDAGEVRARAARFLPEYMVPVAVVVLDEVPRTISGKVDRTALPGPEFGATATRRAPGTRTEELLCAVFADVLGLPAVGVDESFFALGGHSLLGVRLVWRLRQEIDANLSLRDLVESPTPAGLAGRLDVGMSASGLGTLLALRPNGTRPPLFCLPPVTGVSWCYAGLARHVPAELPIYGLQSPRLSRSSSLPGSVGEFAAECLEQIRAVRTAGPYHLLGWSFGGLVAYELAVLLRAQGEEVGLLALLDSHLPTDNELPADAAGLSIMDKRAALGEHGVGVVELEDEIVETIHAAMVDNLRLEQTFTAKPFAGDVTFFTATRNRAAHWRGAEQWETHVGGRVVDHPLPCGHLQMTRPRMLAAIGKAIAPELS
jgi:amino acid adenylation domain-containing protein